MAKKSVKLGLRSGSTVESGDVNVTYNGVRIAGLSESTTATLETENTIVEHDIEIEYTKPAGGGETITVPLYIADSNGDNPAFIDNITVTVGDTYTYTSTGESNLNRASIGTDGYPMYKANIPCSVNEKTITFLIVDPANWTETLDDEIITGNCFVVIESPR